MYIYGLLKIIHKGLKSFSIFNQFKYIKSIIFVI